MVTKFVCTICSEEYRGADGLCAAPCGHVFHQQCLESWFEKWLACPECGKDFVPEDIMKIHIGSVEKNEILTSEELFNLQRENKGLLDENKFLKIKAMQSQEQRAELAEKNSIIISLQQKLDKLSLELEKEIRNSTALIIDKMKLQGMLDSRISTLNDDTVSGMANLQILIDQLKKSNQNKGADTDLQGVENASKLVKSKCGKNKTKLGSIANKGAPIDGASKDTEGKVGPIDAVKPTENKEGFVESQKKATENTVGANGSASKATENKGGPIDGASKEAKVTLASKVIESQAKSMEGECKPIESQTKLLECKNYNAHKPFNSRLIDSQRQLGIHSESGDPTTVHDLFLYAQVLRKVGFNQIWFRENIVFIKKTNFASPIKVYCKQQVDDLFMNFGDGTRNKVTTAPNNNPHCDSQFYAKN